MIDTHVHFWNFDPIRDNWITDDMKIIQHDFLPRDLTEADQKQQLEGCIAVQASQHEVENFFLLALAAESKLIKGIVGWVDLCSPLLEERLGYWKNFPLIKGWRHVLQAENEEFILAREFINGLNLLKNFGYTYDLLCYHDQLPAIIRLVDQVPDQLFVLDHCGKPAIKSKNIATWSENIKILAQNKNIYCKISGLLTEADWQNWTEKEIYTSLDVVFDSFGRDRVMYGSDWPVVNLSRPYQEWLDLVTKYAAGFNEGEQQQLFSGNAKRFYKLISTAR